MAAVGLGPEEDTAYLGTGCESCTVAAVHAPDSVTVSGPGEELERLSARLEADAIFHRPFCDHGLRGRGQTTDTRKQPELQGQILDQAVRDVIRSFGDSTAPSRCDNRRRGSRAPTDI